ncbi:MAG: isoprenyl transferase [Rhodospirillaceae bacterium]|jgi:undecaprenyl diphosphate synthase|nr:isoprenyl transferase [Rhodospirillaceae bacterium]MBT5192497.1 isoprenyl transferase [Rhodospirillaceae bacterium]MBT5897259.1 isoprenyl transferase [Rhodospirillaceae bacterium]MBT7757363.1 isoprenyl transferase [Rhodospirillaceae bacterium]
MSNLSPEADRQPPPTHVAIIMDGNGRWAKARGLPRVAGHQRGVDALRGVVEAGQEMEIDFLTLYAFSSENWKRPPTEVDDLMGLLRLYLRREMRELHRNGVRIRFIGEWQELAPDIVKLIEDAERTTAENKGLTLIIAVNYGSHREIVEASRRIAAAVAQGAMNLADIDEANFARHLHTDGIPDPDLVIRTSGEQRLSNFLLWQAGYAELVFMDVLWPDFTKKSLEQAVEEFHRRERRYGASTS